MPRNRSKFILSLVSCLALMPYGMCLADQSSIFISSFTPKRAYYDDTFTVSLITDKTFDTDTSLNPIYLENAGNNGLISNNNMYGSNTLGFSVDGWSTAEPHTKEIDLRFHGDQYNTLLRPWNNLDLTIYSMGGKSNKVSIPIIGHVSESAVMKFQQNHGLTADGIVGSTTWDALDLAESQF